jgi:hypothetical protein
LTSRASGIDDVLSSRGATKSFSQVRQSVRRIRMNFKYVYVGRWNSRMSATHQVHSLKAVFERYRHRVLSYPRRERFRGASNQCARTASDLSDWSRCRKGQRAASNDVAIPNPIAGFSGEVDPGCLEASA